MGIQVNYDSETFIVQFFSFRSGLFWSFILSYETWAFFLWYWMWYLICHFNFTCTDEVPTLESFAYFFWIFLSTWMGWAYSRFVGAYDVSVTAIGRISDIQSQCGWLPAPDAHDLLRWGLAFYTTCFLDSSNPKNASKGISYEILHSRELLNRTELDHIVAAMDAGTNGPFIIIMWMHNRIAQLNREGYLTDAQFKVLAEEIRELRRNGSGLVDYCGSQIPWPIHQLANVMSVGFILLTAINVSNEAVGFATYVLQVFCVNMVRTFVGRMCHPFRLSVGMRHIHYAPSGNYHAFPLVFGKIASVGVHLKMLMKDPYVSPNFAPYKCCNGKKTGIAFNSDDNITALKGALSRHNLLHVRAVGNSYVVDWCSCVGPDVDYRRSPTLGRLHAAYGSVKLMIQGIIRSWRGQISPPLPRGTGEERTAPMATKDAEEVTYARLVAKASADAEAEAMLAATRMPAAATVPAPMAPLPGAWQVSPPAPVPLCGSCGVCGECRFAATAPGGVRAAPFVPNPFAVPPQPGPQAVTKTPSLPRLLSQMPRPVRPAHHCCNFEDKDEEADKQKEQQEQEQMMMMHGICGLDPNCPKPQPAGVYGPYGPPSSVPPPPTQRYDSPTSPFVSPRVPFGAHGAPLCNGIPHPPMPVPMTARGHGGVPATPRTTAHFIPTAPFGHAAPPADKAQQRRAPTPTATTYQPFTRIGRLLGRSNSVPNGNASGIARAAAATTDFRRQALAGDAYGGIT